MKRLELVFPVTVITAFFAALLLASTSTPADTSGMPRVVDGDTLVISGERIRLHGIDSPETKQTCILDGREWNCGQEATAALVRRIGTNAVTCKGYTRDRYKRLIAVCFVGSDDLNAWMVSKGWALAYRRYSKDYIDEENVARDNRKGIWRGKFMPPWEWRRR
jgi:endonuclease YncB( thermonuclease family)